MKVLLFILSVLLLVTEMKATDTLPEALKNTFMEVDRSITAINPYTGLSVNPLKTDEIYNNFYQQVIPLLIAWLQENHKNHLIPYADLMDGFFPFYLNTPTPGNPYRLPEVDKMMFRPISTLENQEWKERLLSRRKISSLFVRAIQTLLSDADTENFLTVSNVWNDDLSTLYMRSFNRNKLSINQFINRQNRALQSLKEPSQGSLKIFLSAPLVLLLQEFQTYHQHQVDLVDTILNFTQDETFAPTVKDPSVQQFFLSKRQLPHALIHVEPLQKLSHHNAEVMVFERFSSSPSRHLNYKDLPHPLAEEGGEDSFSKTHAIAVAGVIAAKENLKHLKGVAPGAQVLHIEGEEFLSPEGIRRLKESKARVINISFEWKIPRKCMRPFLMQRHYHLSSQLNKLMHLKNQASFKAEEPQSQQILSQITLLQKRLHSVMTVIQGFAHSSAETDPACNLLSNFVSFIQEKDMLIVKAAGNEALPLEEVEWFSGRARTQFGKGLKGVQYMDDGLRIQEGEENEIELTSIFTQLPELAKRIVVVGDLHQDGVTLTPTSSVPGYAPHHFIYAPSGDIMTINPEERKSETGRQQVIELNPFGGTSGAAPRVAGVFVLLGDLFPELSMTEIKQCVLHTGDPFWLEVTNKYKALQDIAKLALYDLKSPRADSPYPDLWDYFARLYGKGRINAMNAYYKCQELREKKRQTKTVHQDLMMPTKKGEKNIFQEE